MHHVLWNHLPNGDFQVDGGLAPVEIYTSSKLEMSCLKVEKTLGCPSYVLDPRLQDGENIPKWEHCTRLGQFLGRFQKHAGSVGLTHNLRTRYISPQFHVVYDNKFHTVMGWDEDNLGVVDCIWSNVGGHDSVVKDMVDPARCTS